MTKISKLLLALTVLLAFGLATGLWLTGVVPFNLYTFCSNAASIYIGIASVLFYERFLRRDKS